MENAGLRCIVDGLGPAQLQELHQLVVDALRRYDATVPMDGNQTAFRADSIEFDRSTFSSSASTLYRSGRSTPQASSISSERTIGIDSRIVYAPGIQSAPIAPVYSGQADNGHAWITSAVSDRSHQHCREMRYQRNSRNPTRCTPNVPQIATGAPEESVFFCTFCAEQGVRKTFRTKQDWKRHEQVFHDTGNIWLCQITDCSENFFNASEFEKHFKKHHEGQGKLGESKVVQQRKRGYGCGFDRCRVFHKTWKSRCDHVAIEVILERQTDLDWNYSRTIRNLLRHPDVYGAWKSVYCRLCPLLGILQSDLEWDPKSTMEMRSHLEYLSFQPDLDSFLERLFWAGVKATNVRTSASLTSTPFNSLSLMPADISNEMQGACAAYGILATNDMPDPALNITCLETSNHPEQVNDEATPQAYRTRNSIIMTDAPALPDITLPNPVHSQNLNSPVPSGEELMSWQEWVRYELPIAELTTHSPTGTPPVSEPATGNSVSSAVEGRERSGSRRKLMRKSKEWLSSKRSQQFNTIDHPDLPQNMQLPAPAPRKNASNFPGGTSRMCSFQS